jgi:hypothetical protein
VCEGGASGNIGTVNVAMKNELVVTRFLFFYPTGPKDQNFGWKHGLNFIEISSSLF